jgi:hypothetical protein
MAAYWQIDVAQSKADIAAKVDSGNNAAVGTELYNLTVASEPLDYSNVQYAPGVPVPAEDIEQVKSYAEGLGSYFLSNKFTYCDAEILSKKFQEKVRESKAILGVKVLSGLEDLYKNQIIPQAKTEVFDQLSDFCKYADPAPVPVDFWDTVFTTQDAYLIAALWNQTVVDAKAIIASKVTYGIESVVSTAIAEAIQAGPENIDLSKVQYTEGSPIDIETIDWVNSYASGLGSYYSQNKFSYCDAEVVSLKFNEKIRESKSLLGNKVLIGYEDYWANEVIPSARVEVQDRLSDFCRVP